MMKKFSFQAVLIISLITLLFSRDGFAQHKPLVVFVTGDHEYSSELTMPQLAAELEKNYAVRTKVLLASPDHNGEENIPGLEVLKQADLAVFYLRWRRLPAEQLAHIEAYLQRGKPLIGFRTTTHAFNFPKGHPSEPWNAFAERAFAAPPGWGGAAGHTHYGHESQTRVTFDSKQVDHPLLKGVATSFEVPSWLYHVLPQYPLPAATRLLWGKAVGNISGQPQENPVAWSWVTAQGAKSFMTTLGHPEDFYDPSFQRLLVNAVQWCLDRPTDDWKGPFKIGVPYDTHP
jgi:type 1 glutamine amidotransferase